MYTHATKQLVCLVSEMFQFYFCLQIHVLAPTWLLAVLKASAMACAAELPPWLTAWASVSATALEPWDCAMAWAAAWEVAPGSEGRQQQQQ
jgi:hypothetical protein